MKIRPATPADELAFYGRNDPSVCDLMGGWVDDVLVAMAGKARDPRYFGSLFEDEGAWIGFLELKPGTAPLGAMAVVALRQYLRGQAGAVEVQCDHTQPKAERLLTVLGFKPTERFSADLRIPTRKLRIWQWLP